MSSLFSSPDKPTKINTVQINQSVQGYPLPALMGRAKIQQSLLWVDGFTAKQVSQGGGKGMGGGKGGTSYLYSADVIAALCCGPISGVGDVWSGQSWLSNNDAIEGYTISGGSPSYTPANASSGFFLDSGVGVNASYSSTQTDLGSGGAATLSGTDLAPMARVNFGTSLTTGLYSVDPSTNTYHFSSADVGKTVQISYSFALNSIKQQETDLVPAGRTIQVGGSFTFSEDDGVTYPLTGVRLTKVSGTPTVTGTYSVSGSGPATYHFASGDIGAEVTITYKIQNNSVVPTGAPGTLAFSIFEGTKGQAVWSLLTTSFPQAALGYTMIAYAAYDPMSLGFAAEIQQNVFEVQTADAYGSGIVDCNPVQCILQVLTNPVWGLGAGSVPFPTSAIDNGGSGTWGGAAGTPGSRTSGHDAWSWFAANSFFISPVIDHQDSASSIMSKWLEAGMCSIFMSEGLLKLVPYGDTSTAANGATWLAPTSFAAALDDTVYVRKTKGGDPVKISSSPWQDAYNTVQVQWSNRANQYSPEVTPESDQAAINRYGSRIEDPQNWDFVTTLPAATFAASMRVKRNVYTRNSYEFSLPFAYSYLENMDVVSITTSSAWAAGFNNANLNVVNLPVRIQKIVDNPDGSLDITAEDYPFGVHQPTIYNKGIGAGQTQQNLFADPGDSEVVMFEATNRLTGQQGNQIWIGATGASKDWGSCNVFASSDGTTYKQIGTIDTVARIGVLHSSLATGSDPDTSHSMVVDMVENSGALEAGTTTDADLDNTLCFVDGEIISYSACAISGQDQYTMGTYLRRGQMGSTISAHAAGGLFIRLDDGIFKFTYDPTWAGKTLHFKFQSVNAFGNSAQDLSTLTAVSFTVPGLNPGTIDASSGLIINPSQFNVGAGNLGWNPTATSTDAGININVFGMGGWSGHSVPSGVNTSNIYARWTGYLIPSATGLYTIGVNSGNGANLYVAGKPLVANLAAIQSPNATTLTYTQNGQVMLTAGVAYPIVLEYQKGSGSGGIQLLWRPPGGSTVAIPAGNLSTAVGSVTGNLAASWWNGTPGLWFPTGNASVDSTNPLLPTFSPPENAGTGISIVTALRLGPTAMTSPQTDSQNATVPGWFAACVYVSNGIIDIFLDCGSNTGYLYRVDGRNGQVLGQLLLVSNVTTGSWTALGTSYVSANPSAFTGWVNLDCYYGNGYLALWINGTKIADVQDNTNIPLGTSNLSYGSETNTNGKIAPATSQSGSSFLNGQGSIVPNQPIATPSYTTSTTTISLSWSSQSMTLSDGSVVTIPSGTKSYSGLTAGQTYHLYPFVRTSDFTIQFANGSPPPTAASGAFAIAANLDGCYGMTPFTVTLPTSGGGSGGGGVLCPEAAELVDVQGKGHIPVGEVQIGDSIKGHSFKGNVDVYRKVVSVSKAPARSWRVLKGHRISPCEAIWDGKAWTPAYKVPGAVYDSMPGAKIQLHVNSDEFEECNYWLVGGTEPVLTHNVLPS